MMRYNTPMSYEPTESGYEEMPEGSDRRQKAITTRDAHQLHVFNRIDAIHPSYLEPSGAFPAQPHVWIHRVLDSKFQVWLSINASFSTIRFKIVFDTGETLYVHIPRESWQRRTSDAEAVRAAIQQAYLNVLRRDPSPVIVNPALRPLKVITPQEYARISSPRRPSHHDPYRPSAPLARRPTYHGEYRPPTPPLRRAGSSSRTRTSDYDSYQSRSSPRYEYHQSGDRRAYHHADDGYRREERYDDRYVYARPRREKRGFLSRLFS